MQKVNINNMKEAIDYTSRALANHLGGCILTVNPTNHNRHYYLKIATKEGVLRLWVMFKRELFLSFGKIFNTEGAGESINHSILKQIVEEGLDKIVVVYESGNIYALEPQQWEWIAYKNRYIRKTESGEVTASVPIGKLERWV